MQVNSLFKYKNGLKSYRNARELNRSSGSTQLVLSVFAVTKESTKCIESSEPSALLSPLLLLAITILVLMLVWTFLSDTGEPGVMFKTDHTGLTGAPEKGSKTQLLQL